MADATGLRPLLQVGTEDAPRTDPIILPRALRAIRTHLRMDVAFVAEFSEGRRVFRVVDAAAGAPMAPGDSDALEDTYCQRIVDGRLPQVIIDAEAVPEAARLAAKAGLRIGSHISVPIRLRTGDVYGTFCCFSFAPERSLNERDLDTVRAVAEVAAAYIDSEVDGRKAQTEKYERLQRVVAAGHITAVYQPIYALSPYAVAGFEALSRIQAEPLRTPDHWFNEAAEVGLGCELERVALRAALRGLPELPAGTYLSLNAAPETVVSGCLAEELGATDPRRIVIEITEHASIAQYAEVAQALAPLRDRGTRVAVDDAGAGYASFRHILALQPDIIKLDMSLTRAVHKDMARRALAAALIDFAKQTDCEIVAEGVETAGELACLKDLGVNKGQGYYLGRPAPIEQYRAARSSVAR